MKIQELPLPASKTADIHCVCSVDAHALKRWTMGDWRDDEPSAVLKADEAPIEKMINAWSQEKAILAVEPFLV